MVTEVTQAAPKEAPKVKPTDYKSALKAIWCPGCGDFGVLNAIYQALAKLHVPPHEVAVISGIGCSSRIPGYCLTYGFNSIHGRALPIATGVKVVSPDLTVIAAGGDGDGLSIGGGHFPHAGRRNVDITYVMMDNSVYGLTKGQTSPTTPIGDRTKSSPYGSGEKPLDAVALALAYNVSFVCRGFSGNMKHLADLIVQAIQHKGFSFVHVLSPCATYRGMDEFKRIKALVTDLDEDYDPTSISAAYHALIREDGKIPLGVFYKEDRPTLNDIADDIMRKALPKGPQPKIEEIMKQFMP